ncbi:hypothetical protein HanRHA438_Chr06g0271651 [Helianthus annuus]|uniref:Uncharacterized protein n=1 Tax=Helianthus annuus TaxID=4232 RepID=A0A251UH34_HELAN|nr:hypothetical protein HanXRQr2_Chr06g0262431 [Helianthus annuus]KAJ0567211.1 hypothetical protein HanIR_Chr06g0282191 [Helianthus annuus]KAJ0912204.1 hypothetical protein HanRHA438_Chr06g0271641 [Helianthus annuus]KAJ0912205.1 hypothetical protein HanRHA438_Chr06g0271651 [Helianthus annuus]KAJ0915719.1 hypothetical protein HanPSC8_Chr06g0253111 [Helianthus annuus]
MYIFICTKNHLQDHTQISSLGFCEDLLDLSTSQDQTPSQSISFITVQLISFLSSTFPSALSPSFHLPPLQTSNYKNMAGSSLLEARESDLKPF